MKTLVEELINEHAIPNCIYITLKPEYALLHSKLSSGNGFTPLFQAHTKKKLNIFNPKSSKEIKNLENILLKNGKYNIYGKSFEKLKENDWPSVFKDDKERTILIQMLKEHGYDGCFNYVLDEKRYNFTKIPIIVIFNINILTFTEVDLKKQKWFKELHEKDVKQLKRDLYIQKQKNNKDIKSFVDSAITDLYNPKYLSLSTDEAYKIIKNFDEADKDLKNDELLQAAIKNNGDTGISYHGTRLKFW